MIRPRDSTHSPTIHTPRTPHARPIHSPTHARDRQHGVHDPAQPFACDEPRRDREAVHVVVRVEPTWQASAETSRPRSKDALSSPHKRDRGSKGHGDGVRAHVCLRQCVRDTSSAHVLMMNPIPMALKFLRGDRNKQRGEERRGEGGGADVRYKRVVFRWDDGVFGHD